MKNASLLLLLLITGRADPYYTNLSSSPLKNSFRYKQNRLLLTKKKIKKINQRIRRRGYVVDPFHKNFFFSARMIRQYLYQDLNFIKNHACYTADNRRLSPQQAVKPFRNNMALTAIRPIRRGKVIKAVINNPCNLRCMPTDVFRMEKKNDFGCDILQLEFLNLWTKAAVMHYTADKKWVYIRTKNTRGWIKKTNLTVITKAAFNDYFKRKLIVTSPSVNAYRTDKKKIIKIYRGAILPLYKITTQGAFIYTTHSADKKQSFYLIKNTNCTAAAFLPLTFKNIQKAAFNSLNRQYAWGEKNGPTDCSGFIARLFRIFGLFLPRTSRLQIKSFAANRIRPGELDTMRPFLSLVQRPGHILLYIGKKHNRYYVLHNVWKYFDKQDRKHIIGKTVISDLTLGKGSRKGSLRKRIKTVVNIAP